MTPTPTVAYSTVAAVVDTRRPSRRAERIAHELAARRGARPTLFEVGDGSADVGPSVVARMQACMGMLLVIEALGGGSGGDRLTEPAVEHILERVHGPVLVVGPHAESLPATHRLVVPLDRTGLAPHGARAADAWVASFGASAVHVVALEAPDAWPDDGTATTDDDIDAAAATLRASEVDVHLDRCDGTDRAAAVLAACDPASLLVVAAPRFPGVCSHWFATSRRLVRHAPCPVLIVPADLPAPDR